MTMDSRGCWCSKSHQFCAGIPPGAQECRRGGYWTCRPSALASTGTAYERRLDRTSCALSCGRRGSGSRPSSARRGAPASSASQRAGDAVAHGVGLGAVSAAGDGGPHVVLVGTSSTSSDWRAIMRDGLALEVVVGLDAVDGHLARNRG